MQRVEWPKVGDFKVNRVVWFYPSTEIVDWLDGAPGGRYQLELVNTNSYNSVKAAASFESPDDALLFCLTWNVSW